MPFLLNTGISNTVYLVSLVLSWLVLAGIYYHHNRDYGSALFFHRLPTKVQQGPEKKCSKTGVPTIFLFRVRQGSKSHVFFHVSLRLKTSKLLVRVNIILSFDQNDALSSSEEPIYQLTRMPFSINIANHPRAENLKTLEKFDQRKATYFQNL